MKTLLLAGRNGLSLHQCSEPSSDYKRSGVGFMAQDAPARSGDYSGSSLGFGRAPQKRSSGYSGSGSLGFQMAA